MDPITIMAIASTATSMFGSYKQTQAEIAQVQEQAYLQEQELQEFIRRQDINLEILNRDINDFQQSTLTSAAERGVGIDSGSVMQQLADTGLKAANAISTLVEETQVRANHARYGINALRRSAQEIQDAGFLDMVTKGISGAYSISRSMPSQGGSSPSKFSPRSAAGENKASLLDTTGAP